MFYPKITRNSKGVPYWKYCQVKLSYYLLLKSLQKAKDLKQKKEKGNAAFKAGKLAEAHTLYTEALAIDPCNKFTNAKLYFNRATVAAKVLCSGNFDMHVYFKNS